MFAAIYIPDFSLQAVLRHEPGLSERPVALVAESTPKSPVLQLTEAARKAGVAEGLSSTQALARCGAIVIKTRSRAQEDAAQLALWQCAYSFSPHLESTADGICTLDLRGLPVLAEWQTAVTSASPDPAQPELFPRTETEPIRPDVRLRQWAQGIITLLAGCRLRAQAGMAATPGMALHAARAARPFRLVTDTALFLKDLPVASLDPPAEIADILHKWGIHTAGAMVALGRDRIAERLGQEGIDLYDQAEAKTARPLTVMELPLVFEESSELENEIETLEPLLFLLRRFLEQLSRRLEVVYLVAAEIVLDLTLASGDRYERCFKIPAPTRDVDTLFRMLHTHMENVRTAAPIVGLRLRLNPSLPQLQQFGLFEPSLRDPNHFHETLARLTAMLGHERVGTPVVEPGYRSDAFHMEPVKFHQIAGRDIPPRRAKASPSPFRRERAGERVPIDFTAGSDVHGHAEIEAAGEDDLSENRRRYGLPLRRFRPAVRISVDTEGGRPIILRSSKFTVKIALASGPWRSSGLWWDKAAWTAEEWDIQTIQGQLYRLNRTGNEWFLEGVFD